MSKTLFILNDPPYGTERSYNALRLAGALARRPGEEVKVFLMGDAASCAKANQKVPQGYYNVEVMLQGPASRHGVEIGVCGTCITKVIDGMPDHRDHVQTASEKAANRTITVCCSRSKTRRLVLDI